MCVGYTGGNLTKVKDDQRAGTLMNVDNVKCVVLLQRLRIVHQLKLLNLPLAEVLICEHCMQNNIK